MEIITSYHLRWSPVQYKKIRKQTKVTKGVSEGTAAAEAMEVMAVVSEEEAAGAEDVVDRTIIEEGSMRLVDMEDTSNNVFLTLDHMAEQEDSSKTTIWVLRFLT